MTAVSNSQSVTGVQSVAAFQAEYLSLVRAVPSHEMVPKVGVLLDIGLGPSPAASTKSLKLVLGLGKEIMS